ncbi:MAG: hypothetical protein ABIH41_06270 [Nanoarchaeota archaeon]
MNKVRMGVIAALIGAMAAGSARANDATEINARRDAVTVDNKISGPITGGAGYFIRVRSTFDYDAKATSTFALADLTAKVGSGIDAVVEAQVFPDQSTHLRAGAQYFRSLGKDASVYALGTFDVGGDHDAEILVSARATPRIADGLSAKLGVETVTDIDKGVSYATQRWRAGIQRDGYSVGLALDTTQMPGTSPSYAPGIFLQKDF